MPALPDTLNQLEYWIASRERAQADMRPDNHARIIWHEPTHPRRTAHAMVYLHGFTASQGEGEPQHRRLAEALGANLYLPRLPGHGLSTDSAMRGIRAADWMAAAAEALTVGLKLGERVILVGTSMGATLAIQLAAAHPSQIAAVLAWSPGVRVSDPVALAAVCELGDEVLPRDLTKHPPTRRHYSSASVHADGYRGLRELFQHMQPALFQRVSVPLSLACFYRDEQ